MSPCNQGGCQRALVMAGSSTAAVRTWSERRLHRTHKDETITVKWLQD